MVRILSLVLSICNWCYEGSCCNVDRNVDYSNSGEEGKSGTLEMSTDGNPPGGGPQP